MDQQYGANHYQNIEINKSYQQNGYALERSPNNLEMINEGYITKLQWNSVYVSTLPDLRPKVI